MHRNAVRYSISHRKPSKNAVSMHSSLQEKTEHCGGPTQLWYMTAVAWHKLVQFQDFNNTTHEPMTQLEHRPDVTLSLYTTCDRQDMVSWGLLFASIIIMRSSFLIGSFAYCSWASLYSVVLETYRSLIMDFGSLRGTVLPHAHSYSNTCLILRRGHVFLTAIFKPILSAFLSHVNKL